ncbi:hypothetical protein N0V93_003971 [Gnomoniopsis smithogilvyi]|uniref:Initiation-specific alpha-1,6-mannosyltransferase n=1 Tax=Gnomoniopsis smithogilvyi TaxID=1191159 RepID=A0A9W9D0D1_9PEZI|nr:hypothetical protein N0V93_003971 [Gnomoniopsis smithogilvyi]
MLAYQRLRAAKHSNTTALVAVFISSLLAYTLWELTDVQTLRKNSFKWHHTDNPIPHTIWYKLGPQGLSEDASGWVDGCLSKNPTWKAQYMMDQNADEWVASSFSDRPDIVRSFRNLTTPILKADFLRYLLLYREGGMWFDLDVECGETPIDDWIPTAWKANTSLVVGWEFDAGLPNDVSHQLESWTIMSRPGSPYMLQAINDITQAIHDEAGEHSVPISELKLHMLPNVIDFTGPARLTRSVFKALEQTLGTDVDRRLVQGILEPTQLGDVLFMPGWAFSATQGQYPEEDRDKIGSRLVIHHYAGSWKNEHGGERI